MIVVMFCNYTNPQFRNKQFSFFSRFHINNFCFDKYTIMFIIAFFIGII